MSSSGIIYAIIVGAWAVYLVPMWLRREDELNRARETQRYAAAIKVLANKEAFERRWAQPSEADAEAAEALPLAAGQGFTPAPRTPKRANGTETRGSSSPAASATKPTTRPTTAAKPATAAAAARARDTVTANIAPTDTRSTPVTRTRTASAASSAQRPSKAPQPATSTSTGTRTGLMARRRRVVAFLFAISTLGALVSADLGAQYLWVMATPALLLSAYIVRLRREERIRAAARAAKRAAAQEARKADLARAEAEAEAEGARIEATKAEAMRADERAEAERRRHAEATRRRASAAARARAQAFTQEATDLRQASNG